MYCISYIVSLCPQTFVLYLCLSLICIVVFRVLYSVSIGAYTLCFLSNLLFNPYLEYL